MSDRDRDHNTSKTQRRAELDDFWDIDRLVPPQSNRRPPVRPRNTPSAVDIELPVRPQSQCTSSGVAHSNLTGAGSTRSAEQVSPPPRTSEARRPSSPPSPASRPASDSPLGTHYVPPHTAGEATEEPSLSDYKPAGVLIQRVQILGWHSNFHYFDAFAKDAVEYDTYEAPKEARRESFFSYFPQYVQMNRRQAAWYLYWRAEIRAGRFPDTDYAYILLYIFEIINLDAPDRSTAHRRRDSLAAVWMAYRRAYPQLDHYMCEWLCDYCLIHALPAPLDLLAPALDDIILGSRLKEFYLVALVDPTEKSINGHSLETARILMRHCCQYDYHKSKFAQGEHKELFDRTIPAAISACLPLLLGASEQEKPAIPMLESTVVRDAYTGALCSYRSKRRIKVTYTSFSRSHELRFLIGDMVKHVENRLRSWIGVRSRLSVMSLPTPLRDALDAFLAPIAPSKTPQTTKKKEQPRPAYEALYDLPQKPLSLSDAAAIEKSSWETTRILTEAFGTEADSASSTSPSDLPPIHTTPSSVDPTVDPVLASAIAPTVDSRSNASTIIEAVSGDADLTEPTHASASSSDSIMPKDLAPFLIAALSGNRDAQRAHAAFVHKMPDAIADEINAITAESVIFDMVLEDDGTGFYTVLEDYREEVKKILPPQE